MTKKDKKAVCPHHPDTALVEVDGGPELGGRPALSCPKTDCNYIAILDQKPAPTRVAFLPDETTTVRLSHARLRCAADGTRLARLEFQLFLTKDKLYQLTLPKQLHELYDLMAPADGLTRADLDWEIEQQTLELRELPEAKQPKLKLASLDLVSFRLQKVEHRGRGTPETRIHLVFETECDFDQKVASFLKDALGTDLSLHVYPAQPDLPEAG